MIVDSVRSDFVVNQAYISGYIQDSRLVEDICKIYSSSEIIEKAHRSWNKLQKSGRAVDSLIIDLYPEDIYTLLQNGTQSNKDFLRWRLYRGADIAEELKIPKIIIPFLSHNSMYDMDICRSLFCLLDEILKYDINSLYIIAVNVNTSVFDCFHNNHLLDISHRILFKGTSKNLF